MLVEIQVDQPNQQVVQANIERQLGGLLVQLCIKDAIIEQLRAENLQLKASLRPDFGQNGVHDKG